MLIFCIWVGFDRNNKFIQYFWVTYSKSHPRWVGCKNLIEGAPMGGDLVIFWLTGWVPPQPLHYEKQCPPKFSKLTRSLDSFTKNSPERLYPLNSFLCLALHYYDWNLQDKFGYWLLLQFFSLVSPLKLSLCFYTFSNMFWHLVFINLLFTLYISYILYLICIIHYIIYTFIYIYNNIYHIHYI